MSRPVLALDASTAILLAKVHLLREVAARGEVWMAETAFQEATVKETEDAHLIRLLAEDGLIHRTVQEGDSRRLAAEFRLHAGEADTIVLAREKGAICGTDDGPAIRCLRVLGLPFTSAIALLVALTEGGVIGGELAIELLGNLERFGRYAPRILDDASRRIRSAGRPGEGGVT